MSFFLLVFIDSTIRNNVIRDEKTLLLPLTIACLFLYNCNAIHKGAHHRELNFKPVFISFI